MRYASFSIVDGCFRRSEGVTGSGKISKAKDPTLCTIDFYTPIPPAVTKGDILLDAPVVVNKFHII